MRNILDGTWVEIEGSDQFRQRLKYGLASSQFSPARVQKGTYTGPKWYYLLTYTQSCPRGCCSDDVHELMPLDEVLAEIQEIQNNLDQIIIRGQELT